MIPKWAREILRCPVCHGELTGSDVELRCAACPAAYPVVDGIPVLLPGDAGQD